MRERLISWLGGPEWLAYLVPTYAHLLGIALLAAGVAAILRLRQEGIAPRVSASLALGAWAGGLLGSVLFGVLLHLPEWLADLSHPQVLAKGGLVSWGGYLGGAAGALLAVRQVGAAPLVVFDRAVPFVGVGTFFGRLGCFLGGCDFGSVSALPIAVRYPRGSPAFSAQLADGTISAGNALSLPVHPVQLYEAFAGLALCALFSLFPMPGTRPGTRFAAYAASYAAVRAVIELFRGDDDRGHLWTLSTAQVVSLLVIVAALAAWWSGGRPARVKVAAEPQ